MRKVRTFFNSLTTEQLTDQEYLEHSLLPELGLNNEILNEQPAELSEYFGGGLGLHIWQYPNQFSKYLLFLSTYADRISSYLEIGCRFGGTFITHCEYLRKLNKGFKTAIAVDLMDEPDLLTKYKTTNNKVVFHQFDSRSPDFASFLSDKRFDLVFIDGDHSYEGVRSDAGLTSGISNIQVFHDITSDACPGVVRYWAELKENGQQTHDFYEFTDQYHSVQGTFLGIGVAVKKDWA